MADQEPQEQEQEVELTEAQEAEVLHEAARDTEDELLVKAFERPRDPETGRYVKKDDEPQPQEAQPEPVEEQEAAPEPAKEEKKAEEDEQVPSWRLREINEDRRKVQAENEQMRVQLARFQAAAEQAQRAQAPPPKLDPLINTLEWEAALEQKYEHRLAMALLNQNLAFNRKIYGADKFDKAYEALYREAQSGNTAARDQALRSYDPGEAIMEWFAGRPENVEERVREKLLNDPEFIAQVRGQAPVRPQQGGQQPPRTVVRLPPSLAKVTGSSATSNEDIRTQTDGSEAALFEYALRR
jgi:hypothetical protein